MVKHLRSINNVLVHVSQEGGTAPLTGTKYVAYAFSLPGKFSGVPRPEHLKREQLRVGNAKTGQHLTDVQEQLPRRARPNSGARLLTAKVRLKPMREAQLPAAKVARASPSEERALWAVFPSSEPKAGYRRVIYP